MPSLPSGLFLIPSAANSFDYSLFTWIRIFLVMLLFRHATVAWWDTFFRQAVSQFSWVLFFLRRFLFRHATVTWRDVLFPATVTPLSHSQYPWASSFGYLRRPAGVYSSCTAFGLFYQRWNLTRGERSAVYCLA
jgi:hypothetical protein